jgi:hypothetical protein
MPLAWGRQKPMMGTAITIKKSRSFSSATLTKQNNHGPRKMAKKSGVVLIPREGRIGVGRGVIPREMGAKEERRGAEGANLSISSISQTQTTKANPRVCAHLEAPDGVPGVETVQQTDTVGSG